MRKSEYARQMLQERLTGRGPVKIQSLIDDVWLFTDDGDPRWIGAALSRFDHEGKVRHVSCDANHDHNSACLVEWVGVA